MFENLEDTVKKYDYLLQALSQPEVISDPELLKNYSKELASIEKIVQNYQQYQEYSDYIDLLNDELSTEIDTDIRIFYQNELKDLKNKLEKTEAALNQLLLPVEKDDDKNVIMEIRAGVGGDEAALFALDLFYMYTKYAAQQGWDFTVVDFEDGTVCGLKEATLTISGHNVYSKLKYESGVHRVQRVPETEARGRMHTSTATVAVYPERSELDVQIDPKDVRIDLFHCGGKGGQNVNKVETGVRLVHAPTGIIVACQEERSQLKNRDKAYEILRAKLYDYYNSQKIEAEAAEKKSMLGTGDRSEKIRTYNFPRNSITDHRFDFTVYNLDKCLQGNLDDLITQIKEKENLQKLNSI